MAVLTVSLLALHDARLAEERKKTNNSEFQPFQVDHTVVSGHS